MNKKDVSQVTQRIRIPVKECDYEEYLMSGTRMIQYGVDCASELMIYRDGQAGMFASVQADIKAPVYGCDVIEVTASIERVGNRSRTVKFEIVKIIERGFDNGDIANEVLDEPIKVAEGKIVLVLEEQLMRKE